MLRRARLQVSVVSESSGRGGAGVPAFLLGGALSAVFAVLLETLLAVFQTKIGTILFLAALGAVVAGLSWAFLYAGGVARRRIRLSTDSSLGALWKSIGACGAPPKDHSYTFALLAIVLLVIAWIVVPVVVWQLFG